MEGRESDMHMKDVLLSRPDVTEFISAGEITGWMDKQLKKQFTKLAQDEGVSKTSLFNEAIADLLKKHMRK